MMYDSERELIISPQVKNSISEECADKVEEVLSRPEVQLMIANAAMDLKAKQIKFAPKCSMKRLSEFNEEELDTVSKRLYDDLF